MSASDLLPQLRFGPYVTPVCVVGAVVECEVRGLVTVVGLSKGPIAWPLGDRDGRTELVVFKGLARAVRQESPSAVAAAWGVKLETAEAWQHACRRPRLRRKQTISSPPIPWKKDEDELVARASLAEAARLTGRTMTAVRKRRRILGLPDGRIAAVRAAKADTLERRIADARLRLRASIERLVTSHTTIAETCRMAKRNVAYWKSLSSPPPAVRPLGSRDSTASNLS
jgi:hypothetical protein